MNWGKSIVLAFVLFAIFIGVLVTVCVRQDISLVSGDYYNDELKFQEHMDRTRNADQLTHKPEIELLADHSLRVVFDFQQLDGGKLELYSPSDISEDKIFNLETTNSPFQVFSLGTLKKGNYKVKMTWSSNGKEFYLEKSIYI
ncbi:MAG TPA: FixH family protein [Chryseolinea sp.]